MARSFRATSLLLIALGVAAPALPANAAAANAGGAAPGGEEVQSAPVSTDAVGGAAPGVTPTPVRRASSARTGGALAGRKPRAPSVTPRKVETRTPGARVPTTRRPVPPPTVPTVPGVFPVQGPFSFGGDDARFGAGRTGHIHQGQDVVASSGEPIVAPVAGTVTWKANQPGGAGIYLVVRGDGSGDVRDYVFMHIKRGTVLVAPGETVSAGQQIAQVGATGDASGPHLHFELWIGGWYARGGAPIDPLPQLKRWAGL